MRFSAEFITLSILVSYVTLWDVIGSPEILMN